MLVFQEADKYLELLARNQFLHLGEVAEESTHHYPSQEPSTQKQHKATTN